MPRDLMVLMTVAEKTEGSRGTSNEQPLHGGCKGPDLGGVARPGSARSPAFTAPRFVECCQPRRLCLSCRTYFLQQTVGKNEAVTSLPVPLALFLASWCRWAPLLLFLVRIVLRREDDLLGLLWCLTKTDHAHSSSAIISPTEGLVWIVHALASDEPVLKCCQQQKLRSQTLPTWCWHSQQCPPEAPPPSALGRVHLMEGISLVCQHVPCLLHSSSCCLHAALCKIHCLLLVETNVPQHSQYGRNT